MPISNLVQLLPGQVTHGMSRTAVYQVWHKMLQRCYNENVARYPRYGGRGIIVCKRWHFFAKFYKDMGLRPSSRHSLERKNNDGNYKPSNCVWALPMQQGRNTVRTRHITYAGETKSIIEWSEELGLPHNTIWYRLARGWTVERALSTAVAKRRAA